MRYGTVSFFPNTVIMKINEGDLEKAAFILSGKIFCKILQRMSRATASESIIFKKRYQIFRIPGSASESLSHA